MDHASVYARLIARARDRELVGYTEKHHVTPRCMDRSSLDIVRITPEEHYVAHQLLVKMHPGHAGLVYAALMMTAGSPSMKHRRGGNKLYGWLRRRLSQTVRVFTPETRAKMSSNNVGMAGRTHNDTTKIKMSLALKGRPKSTEHRSAMSRVRLGKKLPPHSEEWRLHQRLGIRNAIAAGCKRPDQTNPEHRARQSARMKQVWASRSDSDRKTIAEMRDAGRVKAANAGCGFH